MKTFPLYLILGICLSCIFSTSMAQQTVFNKVYYDDVQGFHILGSDITPDHGFVMVGKKYDNSGHIMKIDSSGMVVWSRLLSGQGNYGEINDVISNPDSTIVTAGFIYTSSQSLLNVVKWSKDGDTLWTINLDGLASFSSIRIRKSFAGGYLIAASNLYDYTLSNITTQLIKLDIDGELIWSKTYSSNDYLIFLNSVGELPDNSLILTGYVKNKEINEYHLLITRTNESGNPVWSEIMENPEGFTLSEAYDISVTPEGFVVLADIANRISLIKKDFAGLTVWSRTYSWSGWSMWTQTIGNISRLPDGSLIIANSGGNGEIMKTDDSGLPQWVQSVFMELADVVPSGDGGYTAFGNGPVFGVKTLPNYMPQIGVYKTDSLGNGGSCVYPIIQQMQNYSATFNALNIQASDVGNTVSTTITINPFPVMVDDTCVAFIGGVSDTEFSANNMRIYPNPSSGIFSISLQKNQNFSFEKLSVFNTNGKIVYQTTDPSCLRNGINSGYLPEGIYLVRLSMNNEIYSGKLLIKH